MEAKAIAEGIRAVAVGKRGSRACSEELADRIQEEFDGGLIDPIQRAAFLAALHMKGVAPEEEKLAAFVGIGDLERTVARLGTDLPAQVREICLSLARGHGLDQGQAHALGRFLFSDGPGDAARAWIATILRVRYASLDEYAGILRAMHETLAPPYTGSVPDGPPIAQLAEPFDGVQRSRLLTPLIAAWLRSRGYRALSLAGRSSGPKYDTNLLALAKQLGVVSLERLQDLAAPTPELGWMIDQDDLSPAVARWIGIRRKIIKRPFLATLEKYLNPTNARLLIVSAFHPGFTDKSVEIAERAGFDAAIIVFKSAEGTLGLSTSRAAQLSCTVKRADGRRDRHTLRVSAGEDGVETGSNAPPADTSVESNAALIARHLRDGSSGEPGFDARVRYTLRALGGALDWIEERLPASVPAASEQGSDRTPG